MIRKIRRYAYFIRYRMIIKIKRGIAFVLRRSGIFNPFFRMISSWMTRNNLDQFLGYRNNFEKFMESSIMLEKIYNIDRKPIEEALLQEAAALGHIEARDVLQQYFHQK